MAKGKVPWGEEKLMGNYFLALIHTEGDFHWSLIPFILIWVGFITLTAVWLFDHELETNVDQYRYSSS